MKVLPDGVTYFYGYPGAASSDTGEGYKFFNNVPFETVERKVASRMGTFNLPYLNFTSNTDKTTREIYDIFGMDYSKELQFSPAVEEFTQLVEKDIKIKQEMIDNLKQFGKIYQAQPYSDKRLEEVYDPSCLLSLRLNDKLYMNQWIPQKNLPQRSSTPLDAYPYMAKLARSSAGDATFKINSDQELSDFQNMFSKYEGEIPTFYEKLVQGEEFGVEFYRTHEGKTGIISIIKSKVDENNSYCGGVINNSNPLLKDEKVNELMETVFAYLDKQGWYGRGGLDVIRDESGHLTVIDPNIRVTQIMGAARDSYLNQYKDNLAYKSFTLDLQDQNSITNLAEMVKTGIFKGYSGTIYKGVLYGDGGIFYDQDETLGENRKELQAKGLLI